MSVSSRFHPLWMGGLAALVAAAPAAGEARSWWFHADHVLGTSLDLHVRATDEAMALIAAGAAKAEIARLDAVLSGWRDDSELAALNAAPTMQVSEDLFRVLEASERWRERTGGAFDGRMGEVMRWWRHAADTVQRPVKDDSLELAVVRAGAPVRLEPEERIVSRPAGVMFALDGLAKGYIVDAALAAARRASPGLTGLMIDIGGDMSCWGQAPGAGGWRIGISDPAHLDDNAAPLAVLRLSGKAVATSGRGPRDFRVSGRSYSHLISPCTGLPAEDVVSATVVADLAADADALATALSVMPPDEGLALADRLPGIKASLVAADGRRFMSRGWNELTAADHRLAGRLQPATSAAPVVLAQAARPPPAAAWPDGFSLDVQYEIPASDRGRYRRPYVVIWIADERRRVVRTLHMLGGRPGWQNDNYVWWRQAGGQAPALVDVVSRPTRAPGRYTVSWDGTDDQGRRVPQGRYVLHVEAARQYGGHSHRSSELSLNTTALERALPGEGELGATRLTYGRKR